MSRGFIFYNYQIFFFVCQCYKCSGSSRNPIFLVSEHRAKTNITKRLRRFVINRKIIGCIYFAANSLVPTVSSLCIGDKLLLSKKTAGTGSWCLLLLKGNPVF